MWSRGTSFPDEAIDTLKCSFYTLLLTAAGRPTRRRCAGDNFSSGDGGYKSSPPVPSLRSPEPGGGSTQEQPRSRGDQGPFPSKRIPGRF